MELIVKWWYEKFGNIDSLGPVLMVVLGLFLAFLLVESIYGLRTGRLIFKFIPRRFREWYFDETFTKRIAFYQVIFSLLMFGIFFFGYVLGISYAPGYGIYQGKSCIFMYRQ